MQALIRALALCATLLPCGATVAQEITAAEYLRPTNAYPHGVLGDDLEWSQLRLRVERAPGGNGSFSNGRISRTFRIEPGENKVYEDLAPRLWDITGDGKPEVVVIESHQYLGARLAVLGLVDGRPEYIATTPYIGTRFRWLAPVGAADFDGDGNMEIAYVDRPHLARTLRVWRYSDEGFEEIDTLRGLTNHRIGEDYITGGVRNCGKGPEMVLVDANWQWIMVARYERGNLDAKRLAPFDGIKSFASALACR